MKKVLLSCVAVLSLLLTSCGVAWEATNNQNQIQTQVVLSQKHYRIVKTISGESKQTYVLGIGGLSKKSLSESAMSDMMKNANLQEPQATINTNVQYKNQFYFLWCTKHAIANGTVIEFIE